MSDRESSKKKSGKTARDELVKELTDMIKDIDEEGLLFLVEQANVLLYNMRVEKINKKIARFSGEKKQKGKASGGGRVDTAAVDIEESADGEFFYIIVNRHRIFFTREEMKSLVRVCHAAEDAAVGARRMYNWLARNRQDFLIDGDIGGAGSRSLAELYDRIIHSYKIKH
jgi:hypothetical protein